jgi:hypothetical protein
MAPGRELREREERELDEIVDDIAEHNPDPTTRREALELELEDEGRSDEGSAIGDHIE